MQVGTDSWTSPIFTYVQQLLSRHLSLSSALRCQLKTVIAAPK